MSDPFPLVCICIPCYNAEKTITETLASILKQTYPNFIVRIFDNASTDRTVEMIKSFGDSRVTVYTREKNEGALANFNRCIEFSCGKYTEMFHTDEVYEPELLSRQVEVMESNSEVGAVFTEAYLIDAESDVFGKTRIAKYLNSFSGETVVLDYEQLFPVILRSGNFLLCSGGLVRTEIYRDEIKSWRGELFRTSCDLDVWLRILEKHKIAFILKTLMRTRSSQSQASYLELKRNVKRADMFLVLDHYLDKPGARELVKRSDLVGYNRLQRVDTARRAMNHYLVGDLGEASGLLKAQFDLDLFVNAFNSKRGLLTFLLMVYLRAVILLRVDGAGRKFLQLVVVRAKK